MYIAPRSKTCESGSTESATSSGVKARRSDVPVRFETTFECVSITPFGSPVVPDV